MRKYTLSLLSKLSPDGTPIVETEILTWANQRLESKGVFVKHFQARNYYEVYFLKQNLFDEIVRKVTAFPNQS